MQKQSNIMLLRGRGKHSFNSEQKSSILCLFKLLKMEPIPHVLCLIRSAPKVNEKKQKGSRHQGNRFLIAFLILKIAHDFGRASFIAPFQFRLLYKKSPFNAKHFEGDAVLIDAMIINRLYLILNLYYSSDYIDKTKLSRIILISNYHCILICIYY